MSLGLVDHVRCCSTRLLSCCFGHFIGSFVSYEWHGHPASVGQWVINCLSYLIVLQYNMTTRFTQCPPITTDVSLAWKYPAWCLHASMLNTQLCSREYFMQVLARLVQTPYFSVNDLEETVNHHFTPDLRTRHRLVHFSLPYIFKGWNIEQNVFELRLQSFLNVPSNPLLRILTRISLLTLLNLDKMGLISLTSILPLGSLMLMLVLVLVLVLVWSGCHAVTSITCVDIKPSIRVSTSSSGSADLLEPLDCLFTPPSSGTALPIRRIPFALVLIPHFDRLLAAIVPHPKALPCRTMVNVLGAHIN